MSIKRLLGKTLTDVSVNRDQDQIIFTCEDGVQYKMYHSQDCCESVTIEDINGDIKDLIGSPITLAKESASSELSADQQERKDKAEAEGEYWWGDESFTWTFYKLATVKGYVDIRWYGSSNGYYSENVDFVEIGSDEE